MKPFEMIKGSRNVSTVANNTFVPDGIINYTDTIDNQS